MTCKKRRGIAFPYRVKATAQIISIFGQISQNSDTLIHLPGLQQLLGFPCMRQFTAARNTTSAAAGRSASSTPSRRFCSCCFKAVKAVQPSLIFRCSRFKSIRKCAPCFFGVFNLSSSPFWCDITGFLEVLFLVLIKQFDFFFYLDADHDQHW